MEINLRDEIALEAMKAMLQGKDAVLMRVKEFARRCYELSDAMLDEKTKYERGD